MMDTSQHSVLDYLSFQANAFSSQKNNNVNNSSRRNRMQGVLWKRRDLFKNHWRPRWFVLHHEQHLLTYYLLANNTTNLLRNQISSSSQQLDQSRSSSASSSTDDITTNTVDYDVVPRGSIYLLGTSIEINQLLTNPEESLYVLTLTDHETASYVHLAARSVQARDQWMQQISLVCSNTNSVRQQPSTRQQPGKSLKTLLIPHLPTNIDWNAILPQNNNNDRLLTGDVYEKVGKMLQAINWVEAEELSRNHSWGTKLENATSQVGVTLPLEVSKQLEQVLTKAFSSSSTPDNDGWETLSTPELTNKLPVEMVDTMDQLLQTYLPYIEQKDHPDLTFKFDTNGVHASFHKTKNLIRSIRHVQDHSAVDYLKLLWVFERDLELESNVTMQEPLHEYNSNTGLIYKAYQAVWPTGPREFCSAAHWRLLKNTDGRLAVCLLAFSCPQADSFRPNVAPKHVRGHLDVSLQIWEQTPKGCIHTRILSYDLKGQIPKAIMQTVLTQQADLPRIMDAHLQKVKSRSNSKTDMTDLKYENLFKILQEQDDARKASKKKEVKPDDESDPIVDVSSTKATIAQSRNKRPSIIVESLVLFAPILLKQSPISILIVFCLPAMILAVRWVFLEWLLQYAILLPDSLEITSRGKICCNFTVDLRSIEIFCKQKGKDQKDPQILTTHVVLRALTRAMDKNPSLLSRQLSFLPPVCNTSMIVHDNSAADKPSRCIWIPPAQQQSIPQIATFLKSPLTKQPSILERYILGPSCSVWLLQEHTSTRLPPFKMTYDREGSPISICITPYQKQQAHVRRTNHLEISITFQSTQADACRSFAEQVQQLMQIPEMCDE